MIRRTRIALAAGCLLAAALTVEAADTRVTTTVYARTAKDYKRERQGDGTFKPEYFAIANGGRLEGTTTDVTVDRVTYPEVAEIAMRLLATKNYRYAASKQQAQLLIVVQWGTTIAFNSGNYAQGVNNAASAMANLKALGGGPGGQSGVGAASSVGGTSGGEAGAAIQAAEEAYEGEMLRMLMENRARDKVNEGNAKVLGYLDEINDSNDIRRWAGGGDRYNDLVADIEESRYYIVISAYDFATLTERNQKNLRWQTKVSVRAPGNRFDDSVMAMMKSAAKYFGENNRRLIRGEETKGTVTLDDIKFLGEQKEPEAHSETPGDPKPQPSTKEKP